VELSQPEKFIETRPLLVNGRTSDRDTIHDVKVMKQRFVLYRRNGTSPKTACTPSAV